MEKRNTIFISIFIVVAVVITGISLTYAFIGRSTGNGNILSNTVIKDPSAYINMSISGDTEMALDISLDQLSSLDSSNYYTSYISATSEAYINLSVDSSMVPEGVECEYQIKYIPSNGYILSSGAASTGLKELVILGTSTADGSGAIHSFDESIAGNDEVELYHAAIWATEDNDYESNINWSFEMRFYNLDVDQSSAIGQNPSGKIEISNAGCQAA